MRTIFNHESSHAVSQYKRLQVFPLGKGRTHSKGVQVWTPNPSTQSKTNPSPPYSSVQAWYPGTTWVPTPWIVNFDSNTETCFWPRGRPGSTTFNWDSGSFEICEYWDKSFHRIATTTFSQYENGNIWNQSAHMWGHHRWTQSQVGWTGELDDNVHDEGGCDDEVRLYNIIFNFAETCKTFISENTMYPGSTAKTRI